MKIIKSWSALGVVGVAITLLPAFWPSIPDVDKQTPLAAVNPAPTHVEWSYYPVGGMILVNPALRDSAGNTPYLRIPEGSVLGVPLLVPGPDPDSLDTERRKT
jgi:hypothetical protein